MDYAQIIAMLPQQMTIICACGKQVTLENEGGQYPEFYIGTCECGLKWQLVNLNAVSEDADE